MASITMLRPKGVAGQDSEPLTKLLARADFAFQPIVTTSSMTVHGFEALARFPEGTRPVCDLLDQADAMGNLRALDLGLVRKAISKFARFEGAASTRLFCNVDNRTHGGSPATMGGIRDLFADCGLAASNLCLEISERAPVQDSTNLLRTVELLNGMGVRIALDDFGVGMSGLHMLLTIEPDYVKIDRAFIDQIDTSGRKQAIVAKLCGLAHSLGFMTVAEGVETEAEFRMARDLGCDLAQGFGIARPTTRIEDLAMTYGRGLLVSHGARMHARVEELLNPVAPMLLDAPLVDAANRFKAVPDLRVIPVIDAKGSVLGALLEEDMRRYLLSDYGPALLANKGAAPRMEKLVRRFPVADANGTVETIVNSYVAADSACGLILSDEGRYAGFLTNNAVLRLAAEAAVSAAREQNPLTQLPGNRSIAHHIGETLKRRGPQALVFFDFDNFKAFNDHYGFAAGDRALMMFADLLRKLETTAASFVGHIGGDDFFASIAAEEPASTEIVHELCAKFASDAESLYSVRDRAAGGIHSVDRFGQNRFYPLLRTSASLLHLPAARAHLTVEMVNDQLATGKQMAKASSSGIAAVRLPESGVLL